MLGLDDHLARSPMLTTKNVEHLLFERFCTSRFGRVVRQLTGRITACHDNLANERECPLDFAPDYPIETGNWFVGIGVATVKAVREQCAPTETDVDNLRKLRVEINHQIDIKAITEDDELPRRFWIVDTVLTVPIDDELADLEGVT